MTKVSKGNLDMLTVLFERYHLRIFNFFNKMIHDRTVSEDLTQDVFYKIMKYRASYKKGNFASWIYTIARNIFSSYYQKQKNERTNLIDDDKLSSKEVLVSDKNQEDIDHLQKALLHLNTSDRELIIMHRFQEINYQQIAEILGSNENAVKVKSHRALKKLKEVYFKTIAR